MPSTVRFRVTAVATAVVIVVLVGVGYGLVINQRRVLTESLDETMAGRVNELADEITSGQMPSLENLGEDDSVAQVVSSDGTVVASSRRIDGLGPLGDSIAAGQRIRSTGDVLGIDGKARLLTRVVESPDGDVVVHFAASMDDIDESVRTLAASLLLAVPLAALFLAALIWVLVGRTLRPVEQIRAEVAAIGGSDLHRRVPVPPGDDEVVRLARTMNDMLERVDEASRRQRQFVADASHELRSPLTRMRSELEVDIAHPDGADPAATHESVLEEVVGLQYLVDDLLLLARNAAVDPRSARRDDDIDVAALAHRVVDRVGDREGVTIHVAGERASVRGNATELARAVGNLVDNAARHAESTVRVAVSTEGGALTVAVEDDGAGVPAGEHERIFERFARADESRAASAGGAGLGLAIARDIVERHGGKVVADHVITGGARFVITLPVADPP